MSVHTVIKCDSDWFGFPCRGAITVPFDVIPVEYVRERGWTCGPLTDLCPAHTLAAKTLEAAR